MQAVSILWADKTNGMPQHLSSDGIFVRISVQSALRQDTSELGVFVSSYKNLEFTAVSVPRKTKGWHQRIFCTSSKNFYFWNVSSKKREGRHQNITIGLHVSLKNIKRHAEDGFNFFVANVQGCTMIRNRCMIFYVFYLRLSKFPEKLHVQL